MWEKRQYHYIKNLIFNDIPLREAKFTSFIEAKLDKNLNLRANIF